MGKSWRRNNNHNRWNKSNNKKSSNSKDFDETNGNGHKNNSYNSLDMNWKAQQDLNRYLQKYRSICQVIHTKLSSKDFSELPDTEVQLLEQEINDEVDQQQTQERRSGNESDSCNSVRIGEHEFPSLSVETILNNEKPYIELPATLNSKERRIVHELCLEYNLYHETILSTENTVPRESSSIPVSNGTTTLVISFYTDGFESLRNPDSNNTTKSVIIVASQRQQQQKLYNYQSWYCRQSAEENELFEKKALESIDALIDQPGTCVRDDVDVIDYEKIENVSLSAIDPPLLGDCDSTMTGSSSWMLVDSLEKLDRCINELNEAFYGTDPSQSRATELAFDLECVNQSKYTQLTCLLQITTNAGKEYIIDPLASNDLFKGMNQLSKFFEDPNIVKIGHSVGGLDCKCLHRDFGIVVINLFDTYECAQLLHLPALGLASICEYYGLGGKYYQQIKDIYQKCDWTIRPLSKEQIQYGRYDVHYLIMLRTLMIRDLTQNEFYYKDTMVLKQREENDVNIARSLAITLQQFDDADNDGDLDNIESVPVVNEKLVVETDVTATPSSSVHHDEATSNGNGQSVTFNDDVQAYVDSEPTDSQILNPYNTPLKDSRTIKYDRQNSNTSTENGVTFMTPSTSFDEYDTRPSVTPYINGDINSSNDGSNQDKTVDVYATPLNIPSTVKKSNVTTKRNDDQSNTESGDSKQTLATAADLRLHARYMTVISISQERCKEIWKLSNSAEPYLQNQSFLAMLHRARLMSKKSVSSTSSQENSTDTNGVSIWTARSIELYHELVKWRNTIASDDLQCLPGLIVSLNFLVAVAWKWPSSENQLRLIQYILPPLLEDSELYRNQLLNIVTTKRKVSQSNTQTGEAETITEADDSSIIEYSYSTISLGLAKMKNCRKESEQKDRNDTIRTIDIAPVKSKWVTTAVAVSVVAVCVGAAIVLLRRRRR